MKDKPNTMTKGGVLLLGGDWRMQESVRAALEAENYEVWWAGNRGEVQELVDAGSINILVIEADSDSESWGRLLTQLKARRPQLGIIGVWEPRNGTVRADANVNVWLEKPLGLTRLAATVNNLLAELRSEFFREELLNRQSAPLFSSMAYRHWGLNE